MVNLSCVQTCKGELHRARTDLHEVNQRLTETAERSKQVEFECDLLRKECQKAIEQKERFVVERDSLEAELTATKATLQKEVIALRNAHLQSARLNHALQHQGARERPHHSDTSTSLSEASMPQEGSVPQEAPVQQVVEQVSVVSKSSTQPAKDGPPAAPVSQGTERWISVLKEKLAAAESARLVAERQRDEALASQSAKPASSGQSVDSELQATLSKLQQENTEIKSMLADSQRKVGISLARGIVTHSYFSKMLKMFLFTMQVEIGEAQISQLSMLLSSR